MSSALTGNKIKDSYQSLLKIGTNGSLDPITPISISDGLGNDTPLLLSGIEFKTQIVGANPYGLWLDLSSNSHAALGDYNLNYNFTQLYVNDYNNIIQTSGGNNANPRGFKFDYANDVYQFGDFLGVTNYCAINISASYPIIDITSNGNFLQVDGNHNNIWLGFYPGEYSNSPAVTNNYMLGTDWYMDNTDETQYPFTYNTILNCYNDNLDTSDKAMSYNFYSNIKGNNFTIPPSPNIFDNQIISNCFIFGIDASNDNTSISSFSYQLGETNTNVVLFNGKALSYKNASTNIFSVNSSGTFIEESVSGITILGGDFLFAKDKKLIKANHTIDILETYGVNITGMRAIARNSFSNVFATRMEGSNAIGQVQVEQIQLSNYYVDGSINQALLNAVGGLELYVQSSSTYQVEAKIVSTTGDGVFAHLGNSYVNATWKVCVDSSGNVDISDYCTGCVDNPFGATTFDLISISDNHITIRVAPDTVDGNECYVKALMTLNCIVFA